MANDFQDRNGTAQAALVNGERDVSFAPNYWRWLMEGKVFEAGFGLEDAEENSSGTAFDDTKVTFALQSPKTNLPIVVPILLKLMMTSDGGGQTSYQVMFTKPAELCATTNALSGATAMTSVHNMLRTNPEIARPKASAYYGDTITSTALVAADYVAYHYGIARDAALTTGLVAFGDGPSNVAVHRFLNDGCPHLLTNGASMLVYTICGTSDGVVSAYMQWAELEESDLH